MSVTDKRTQIYLSADQHAALARAAHERGTSMAWIVREAVAEYLTRSAVEARRSAADPLADLIGFIEGPADLSARHDAYLAGAAGEIEEKAGSGESAAQACVGRKRAARARKSASPRKRR